MRFIELPLIEAKIALIEVKIALIEAMIARAREMRDMPSDRRRIKVRRSITCCSLGLMRSLFETVVA